MYVGTLASSGCIQLHGVQPLPLTFLLPGYLQLLTPVQGLQITLFALLTTLRHRLNRDYCALSVLQRRNLKKTGLIILCQGQCLW